MADSHPDSMGLSSLVVVEPPHIARFKGVMQALGQVIQQNNDGSGMARMGMILTSLASEFGEELADMDEMQVRMMLAQTGSIIAWIGHGHNDQLPETVRPFAEMIQPTVKDNESADTDSDTPIEIGTSAR